MKTVRIGEKVSKFYTRSELAKFLDTTVANLVKMEDRGILPEANYRYQLPHYKRLGDRIYSEKLVQSLIPLFVLIKQGNKTSDDIKNKIALQFKLEKNYFSDD